MESNNDSSSTTINNNQLHNNNNSQPNQQFYSSSFQPSNDEPVSNRDSETMSRDWSRDSRGGNESRDSNNGSNLENAKRSSFFGLPALDGDEQRLDGAEDYTQYRHESQAEGYTSSPTTYGRPSSFYGLEGPAEASSSSSQQYSNPNHNFHAPPSVVNFSGARRDSTTDLNSSFAREPSKGRYHNAPYAASRAASLYAISTNSPSDSTTPIPLLDHSHLQPGVLASLLTHEKTLDLYRANVKKTNDPDVQFEFCTFVMEVVSEMEAAEALSNISGSPDSNNGNSPAKLKQNELVAESVALLNKLANRGHVKSQYFLADCYTQGVGTAKVGSLSSSLPRSKVDTKPTILHFVGKARI